MLLLLKDVPDRLVGVVERRHRGADVGVQRVRDELQVPAEGQSKIQDHSEAFFVSMNR